jgi:uncharacterized membrane protein
VKIRKFIAMVDDAAVAAAIAAAEQKTTGEIRVFVSDRKEEDGRAAAIREFRRLGMEKTRQRNAVLIFIAPKSQTFGIAGDDAVHARVGELFWKEVVAAMSEEFKAFSACGRGLERAAG